MLQVIVLREKLQVEYDDVQEVRLPKGNQPFTEESVDLEGIARTRCRVLMSLSVQLEGHVGGDDP